jgi:hypothetical protein
MHLSIATPHHTSPGIRIGLAETIISIAIAVMITPHHSSDGSHRSPPWPPAIRCRRLVGLNVVRRLQLETTATVNPDQCQVVVPPSTVPPDSNCAFPGFPKRIREIQQSGFTALFQKDKPVLFQVKKKL